MRCMAIVTEEYLKEEAGRYGDAGPRPQVVWPNGVLAFNRRWVVCATYNALAPK